MKALVTGASGFVGRHLVRALSEAGAQVHAVVRTTSSRHRPSGPGITVHELGQPAVEIGEVIEAVRPDTVFHLATHFSARHLPAEIISMLEANVVFGTTLAQACAATQTRLVHATSAWQHYGGAGYEPVSLYAATKQALVDIIEYFRVVEGLDSREVCLFDTYGPEDDRGKLTGALLTAARTGAELDMSSGNQLIDLVHIDDVVGALLVAGEAEHFSGRMVVRTGRPVTVRDLAAIIEEVSGAALRINWGSRPDRGREMITDWEIAANNGRWQPQRSLRDGLADLWRSS